LILTARKVAYIGGGDIPLAEPPHSFCPKTGKRPIDCDQGKDSTVIKRGMHWVVIIAISFATLGCVAQGEMDRAKTMSRTKDDQIANLKARLEEQRAEIEALRAQANRTDPDILAQLEQAQADRDRLQKELADLMAKVGQLPTGPLPAAVDQALMQLAASNPGLMTYDPALGMIRFASDLTFALGSADVASGAVGSLNELARILNTPLAQPYEVRIVGHTDNVPIQRVADRHPTNWHLSVHRAISVKDVIQRAGVSPQRIGIGGYGEFRPVVPNGPRGAQANRRVEIYLVPMAATSRVGATPGDVVDSQPAAPRSRPEAVDPALFK